ncbi:MAG: antibiotic biosynthesis monooxygenase [Acidobacteria bacterium]|nr:MAG: antibiotic biosynthesis monooxygenase [Acidobacteriota bacterium]REK06300.1 MAG: antibiotic biosynthesis monooxygenase [Acidobacteriota bacterium]
MSEHPVLTFVRAKVADASQPFTIIADLEAQPGRGDAVAAAIASSGAIELTRSESGCVAYDVSRDVDAPDRFVAYECWRDLAALESHLATRHFAAVGAALEGLLAGAPKVRVLVPASATGVPERA